MIAIYGNVLIRGAVLFLIFMSLSNCVSQAPNLLGGMTDTVGETVSICSGRVSTKAEATISAQFNMLTREGKAGIIAAYQSGTAIIELMPEKDRLGAYQGYLACIEERTKVPPPAKRVVIMDSKYGLYDKQAGPDETNALQIRRLLSDIPGVLLIREETSPTWNDLEQVRKFEPDLIIIHLSAFEPQTAPTPNLNPMFKTFIDFIRSTKASLIVYSRGPTTKPGPDQIRHKGIWREWIEYFQRGGYEGRVDLLLIPRDRDPSFDSEDDRATTNEIKQLAKCRLELETQQACSILRDTLEKRLASI